MLFDAGCGICSEAVRQLRRWDRAHRLEFVSFASAEASGRTVLQRIATDRPLGDSLHLVDESTGQVTGGGHAALAILESLPGGWVVRPIAALPTTAIAADLVYRVASRHRDSVAWLVGIRDDVACPLGSEPAATAASAAESSPAHGMSVGHTRS